MPVYEYKALKPDGKLAKGTIEADSLKSARQKLKKSGLMITGIEERVIGKTSKSESGIPFSNLFRGRISVAQISLVTRQLASLVKANIPLVEALNALTDQIENLTLKSIFSQVKQDVNEGASLAKAMSKHPKAFDSIFVNMIEAGENSGTLALVLLKLADLKETQMRLRSKISSAMTYPVLMMIIAVVLMLAIFTFVIPKLAKIFESMNKPMPFLTRFLIGMSDIIVEWWYLIFFAFFALVLFFRRMIQTPTGKEKWDRFKLKTPLFGELIRMIAVTRFSNTMGNLLSAGVPILTAMNISKNLVDNLPIQKAISNARENITEGQSIAEPLRRSGEFPPLVIHMIAIGEKTGELPEMLQNIAQTYEEQVNSKIQRMTSLIEPLMIIFMGLAVGVIVLAIFVPLLDLSNVN
jgi:general secretion pathway protein F